MVALLVVANTPVSVPCLMRLLFDIPCPGCGLTRAFIMASRFDILGAITMNLLFLPITIGGTAYFAGAVLDVFAGKHAVNWLNKLLGKKWIIALAVVLTGVSWGYNICRTITTP